MNDAKKLRRLAEHYKVPRANLSLRDWVAAVKKASPWPGEAMEVIYARTFDAKADAKPEPAAHVPAKVDAQSVGGGDGKGDITVIPPSAAPSHVRVEIAAPNVQLALPSINVDFRQDRLALHALMSRALSWSQAFALGALAMFAVITLTGHGMLSP